MIRTARISVSLWLTMAVVFCEPIGHAASDAAPVAVAVTSVGMTVSDMDRSIDFYSKVLTFEKVSDVEVWGNEYEQLQGVFGLRMRVVRMRLGKEFIELTEYLAPQGRPIPVDSRSHDRWFQHIAIIVSDMDEAYRWLRRHKVRHASSGPQRLPDWNPNAGGIQTFYFKDPDGHALEILQFPPGKGDPKWQLSGKGAVSAAPGRVGEMDHGTASEGRGPGSGAGRAPLFLGIDHTAIVVSDTDASLKFYRNVLGLKVVGESENYGTEQEHLNNVFGARLRITSLRAAAGPGIEFLEYVAPRDGRPRPPDARPNDLLHWQTRLATPNAEATWQYLRQGPSSFISPGVVATTDGRIGFKKALLVQDPDGHAIQLVEE